MALLGHYFSILKDEGIIAIIDRIYFRLWLPIRRSVYRRMIKKSGSQISDKKLVSLITHPRGFLFPLFFSGKASAELSDMLNLFRSRKNPVFFISSENRENIINDIKEYYSEEEKASIRTADLICRHDFRFIAPNCPVFGPSIRWHSSFQDGIEWPLDFYMDLDYHSEKRPGDVRQVWELNRHQYFATLGKAYWLTGHAKYADEFIAQIDDWIENNPYGHGINWLHSQETSLRMISWIWALCFFRDYSGLTDALLAKILKAIYQHAEYTYWNLSENIGTHNHIITEACGLAVAGIMFPEFKDSVKWLRKGSSIFFREIIKQIWENGPSGELSTSYHLFVLESSMQLLVLMKKNTITIPAEVERRIEKMIEYVMYLCRPDGGIPLLGDSDSGRAFRLSDISFYDRRYLISTGAVIFQRGDFKAIAKRLYEESYFLLGRDSLKRFDGIPVKPPSSASIMYAPAGIAVFRGDWTPGSDYLIFRGGPTAVRKNVGISHNHADYLSFELYSKGKVRLVDPGTYLYGLDDEWRFWYRKSEAHNSVVVDGGDHLNVTASRFGVPEIHLSTLHNFKSNEVYGFVDMAHSGYISADVLHRRRLLFVPGCYILIVDEFYGNEIHQLTHYFNADTGHINVDHATREALISWDEDEYNIRIIPINMPQAAVRVLRGEKAPVRGWSSIRYGEKHPASILSYLNQVRVPVRMGILIDICNENDVKLSSFNTDKDECAIAVQARSWKDEIIMNEDDVKINRTSTSGGFARN